tara:strand:- start:1227 stop:2132 length:906 start_codon:yes stop_codon:yes gene_type:complete
MIEKNIDAQIDLVDLVRVFWKEKVLIMITTFVIIILTLFYALSLPNLYTSSTLLKLSEGGDTGSLSSLASQYGGLASLAGISLPSGSNDKSDYVIETIESREFTSHLLQFNNLKPMLMAFESYNPLSKVINYDSEIYDIKSKKWVRDPINGNIIPSNLELHSVIKERLSISKNKQSGFINLSFEHKSPSFSKEMLDLIIRELNIKVREKDLNESTMALDYLKAQIIKIEQSEIRKAVFNLIESQLQVQMLANIKKDYILVTIDKPFIPENKSSPARAFIMMMGAFFGLIFSCILALIKHYK